MNKMIFPLSYYNGGEYLLFQVILVIQYMRFPTQWNSYLIVYTCKLSTYGYR